jgi:hypothetical protein
MFQIKTPVSAIFITASYQKHQANKCNKVASKIKFITYMIDFVSLFKIAHKDWQIGDGRAFKLKCNLGKRIYQPLKSRQTETNCTPIENLLLAVVPNQKSICQERF